MFRRLTRTDILASHFHVSAIPETWKRTESSRFDRIRTPEKEPGLTAQVGQYSLENQLEGEEKTWRRVSESMSSGVRHESCVINGDSVPDIVTANRFSTDVSVLLGNGDGTLQPQRRFAAAENALFATVADLDGDGAPDLAVGIPGNVLILRLQ